MPSKDKGEAHRRVVVAGKSPDRFQVVWGDAAAEGRLVPAPRSRLVARDDTDVTAALKAWLQVWSYYELWDRSRTAQRFAKDARLVGPEKAAKALGVDAARLARLTQEAKHCAQRRDAFDEALVETANKFGPLGAGGTEIREIIRALFDLQTIMMMFDPKADRSRLAEIPIEAKPLKRWRDAVDSSRFRVGTWTCPDLYAALVMRVCTLGDLQYGACEVCDVLFVRQRSDRKTCGERCRSLLRSEKQRRKRA
jgi:hypothetical protein